MVRGLFVDVAQTEIAKYCVAKFTIPHVNDVAIFFAHLATTSSTSFIMYIE